MGIKSKILQAVGRNAPSVEVLPVPIRVNRAPTTADVMPAGALFIDTSTTPDTVWISLGNGDFSSGGNEMATTTTAGIVTLTDNNDPVATKFYADALAIAGSPVSTTTTAGIGQLATDAEAIAGTPSTGALALFVTPSNLAAVLAAGGPGSFTTLAASGAVTFGSTGAISMTSDTASLFDVTGAGVDLTLSSDAGRVIVNGEEAAANAITLVSAVGGIDVDAALQINIASSQNAVDAIRIVASAGGIDIDAVGIATEDINITNTGGSVVISATENVTDAIVLNATLGGIQILASGASATEDISIIATGSSVNIESTENAALAVYLHANGGASETIRLRADQGTGVDSIDILSDVGGITLTSGLASADAINFSASAGGFDVDAALQVNIASSQNAVDAIRIVASAGGIDIDAVGAATEDINITNTGGSILLVSTEAATDAIVLTATTALAGIDVNAGTGGMTIDSAGVLSLDSAGATNLTATGAFDITVQSTAGSILINAGEAVADAINIDSTGGFDLDAALQVNITSSQAAVADSVRIFASAASGGIDVDAGTGGITIDSTGVVSIDSAGATNLTATGAFDVTVSSTAGSVILTGAEAAVDAIQLNATTALGGIDVNAGTGGITIDSAGLLSIDSAGATNLTATGAFDITINSTAGSVIVSASESAVDALQLLSTAGGIDILASGAAAGEDIDIVATGSSVNITATENVTDAIVINASGAASALQLDAGTGSIRFGSGLVVPVTTKATADTPYTVLGTDYFISCDTSGGVLQVTLPAATALAGRSFVIRDTAGNAAVNNITINGGGTNLVGGGSSAATKVLSAAYSGATVYSNGVTWNYAYTA